MDATPPRSDTPTPGGRRRPGQTVECGWCGQPVPVPSRGRIPSWCSSSCRHRAWEAGRAERDNLPEVRVVTRTIEVEKPVSRSRLFSLARRARSERDPHAAPRGDFVRTMTSS